MHLVGIKTETWFKIFYNRETHRHEKHTVKLESFLYATKGWRKGRKHKKIEIVPYYNTFPRQGYSVRFK